MMMNLASAFRHDSSTGPFFIHLEADGRWHVVWEGDDLGSFDSPEVAAEEVADGCTFWPKSGNPALMNLSPELKAWTPLDS